LVKANGTTVVDVEEFETFSEVTFFSLRLGTLLSNLIAKISLEALRNESLVILPSDELVHLLMI